jgi:hypothetical protein
MPDTNTPPLENITGAGKPQDKAPEAKEVEAKYQEIEKQNKELQAKLSETAERAKQADELLNVFLSTQQTTPSRPAEGSEPAPLTPPVASSKIDYSKFNDNPEAVLKQLKDEAKEEAKKEMRDEYIRHQQTEQYNKQVHDYFYGRNPDLVEHKALVGTISKTITEANKGIPIDKLLDKIATESKAEIARIRAGGSKGDVPPVVTEAGSGVMSPKPPESKPAPVDDLTAEAQNRNKSRNKILT